MKSTCCPVTGSPCGSFMALWGNGVCRLSAFVLMHFTFTGLTHSDGPFLSTHCTITPVLSVFPGWHARFPESWHFQYSAVIFNMFNRQFLKPSEGRLINLLCNITDNPNPHLLFPSYRQPRALVQAVSGFKVSNFLSQTSLARSVIPKRVLSKATSSLIATVSFSQRRSPCYTREELLETVLWLQNCILHTILTSCEPRMKPKPIQRENNAWKMAQLEFSNSPFCPVRIWSACISAAFKAASLKQSSSSHWLWGFPVCYMLRYFSHNWRVYRSALPAHFHPSEKRRHPTA